MTEPRNSSDAASGVVMGKTAGAALAGEGVTKSVPFTAVEIDGGALVARVLQSQGAKYLFAVNGGHTWPIFAALRNNGIKLIHMRHEQSCAYAADGWARTTGTPGICGVTAGCGLTNAVTGLCAASLAGSAVVCIAGQHPITEDGLGSFQEAYGGEVCRSFSKFTKRVLDWSTIEIDLRQAFREAKGSPQGVALVEIPTNILYLSGPESNQRRGAKVYAPGELRSGADPQSIEQAIQILLAAKRPLIAAGDGIFWSGAAAELCEFVELTKIPVYARRTGQGAVAEDHPLAIRGPWKKPFTGRADAVLAIGFRFWSGEKFGEAPTWSQSARYIQADATPTRIGLHVPAEVALVGDPKLVLRQLGDAARAKDWRRSGESDWHRELAEVRANFGRAIVELEREHHADTPIHPARIARELCEVIDPDATIVIDSFTMSGWMSQWFHARFPGQIVDAGPLAPVGHGVGMAIGAQLARPGKQVILIIGDGGLGISGFDLETARRYRLPIVAILWNNSSWGPSFDQMPFLKGRTDSFEILPNQRYDRMFELMDCHGEHVERPEEFRPSLERALSTGKTALVNVVGDRTVGHPSLGGNLLGSTRV
ncbi:MAG: thiamine pyrophosphate-binding protein [Deltaproteobacteria bacterium]|nr:thiamine pyrophosphate-binding protein [Deltaproteobacteria bacterium]